MADSDDEIYVDVVPKLDENAANEVEGKLRGKFSHVGDSLKDSLTSAVDSIGDHLGGAGGFGDKLQEMLAGSFSGREWDDLGKRAGGALGEGIGESLKDITSGNFGNILGEFGKVGDVLGSAVNQLSSKLDGLQKAGGALGNVLSGSGSGSDITDILGGAKGLGLNIPAFNQAEHVKKVIDEMNKHPGKTESWLSDHIPGLGVAENIFEKGPQKVGTAIHDWFTGGPGQSPTRDAASDAWSSKVAGAIDIQSQVATISAGSVSLGGDIPCLACRPATASPAVAAVVPHRRVSPRPEATPIRWPACTARPAFLGRDSRRAASFPVTHQDTTT